MINFGGNDQVKRDPIWIIAARNNEFKKEITYRINGNRVSKSEYDLFKRNK